MEFSRYNKNDWDVFDYRFSSLTEYVEHLRTAKTSSTFRSEELSSQKTGDVDWCGTESFEQAMQFCLGGEYSSDYDRFDRTRIELEKHNAKRRRAKTKRDVMGFAPNVPAYLRGEPLNMFNLQKEQHEQKKVINLYYNITASAFQNKQEMMNRGICTLALIKDLENAGYIVNLRLFECSKRSGQLLYTEWKVKDAGKPLDYRKCYFPLVNPAFLRRLHFRVVETTEGLESGWTWGYGQPAEPRDVSQFLGMKENDFLINTPQNHGIRGNSITEDYDSFVKTLRIEEKLPNLGKGMGD